MEEEAVEGLFFFNGGLHNWTGPMVREMKHREDLLKHRNERGTHIQGRSGEQDVGGLSHVGGVQAVVIGHVRVVVVLQGHHVGHERVGRDLERLQEVSLLPETKKRWRER